MQFVFGSRSDFLNQAVSSTHICWSQSVCCCCVLCCANVSRGLPFLLNYWWRKRGHALGSRFVSCNSGCSKENVWRLFDFLFGWSAKFKHSRVANRVFLFMLGQHTHTLVQTQTTHCGKYARVLFVYGHTRTPPHLANNSKYQRLDFCDDLLLEFYFCKAVCNGVYTSPRGFR